RLRSVGILSLVARSRRQIHLGLPCCLFASRRILPLKRKGLTINRPAEELYRFWRDLENLPRFMENLEAVQVTGETRSHWKANGPAGMTVEWDAEILEAGARRPAPLRCESRTLIL